MCVPHVLPSGATPGITELRFWAGALPPLLGVLVGAGLTFLIQTQRDRRQRAHESEERRAAQADAARRAQFALVSQRSSLRDIIKDQELTRHIRGELSWWDVRPLLDFCPALTVDFQSLAFLLSGNADLVYRMHVAEGVYRAAAGAVQVRNTFLVEFHNVVAAAVRAGAGADDARKMADLPWGARAEGLTIGEVESVGNALLANTEMSNRLLAALKAEFVGEGRVLLGFADREDPEVDQFLAGFKAFAEAAKQRSRLAAG
jgi:hypothetical protein